MSSTEEQRRQKHIEELRGELGETVAALAHKVDVPARAKQRGQQFQQQAAERCVELLERSQEWKQRLIQRGSVLRERALDASRRARHAANRSPKPRWATLASGGIAAIILIVIIRRVRAS
jgi:phosphate starvation-inducible protein PhoH